MNLDKEAVKVLAEEMMKAVKAIIQDNNKNYVNNQIRNYTGGTAAKFTGVIKPSQVKGLYGAVSGFLTDAANSIDGYADIDISTNAFVQAVTRLAKVEVQHIIADTVEAQELYASYGNFINLVATQAEIGDLDVGTIKSNLATISFANIGDAKISSANIEVASVDTAFIRQGLSGKYYIDNLAVTNSNMLFLTVGNLMLRDEADQLVQVKVDKDGNVFTEHVQITGEVVELDDEGNPVLDEYGNPVMKSIIKSGTLNGAVITDESITAQQLNVEKIFAIETTTMELIAQNIKASTIFATEGNISALKTAVIQAPDLGKDLDIKSNASITLANDYIGLVIDKNETNLESSKLVLTNTMLAATADKIDLSANKSVTSRIADSMYNKIITQPEEPENPDYRLIWGNSSNSPIKYYRWTGFGWDEIKDIDSNSILLNELIQDMSTKISQENDRILLEVTEEHNTVIEGEIENLSLAVSRIEQRADSISLTVGRQRSVYIQSEEKEGVPEAAQEGDVWRDPNSPDYYVAGNPIDEDGLEFAYDDDGGLLYSYEDATKEIFEFGIEDDEVVYKPVEDKGWDDESVPEGLSYHAMKNGVFGNWKIIKNIAFSQLEVKADKIYSTVFKYDPETGEEVSVVEQSAEKIDWMVTKTTPEGSETSQMTLTSEALEVMADKIDFSARESVIITSAGQISADAAENLNLSANETVHIYSGSNIETEAMEAITASVDDAILELAEGKVSIAVGKLKQTISDTKFEFETITKAIVIDDDGLHIGDKDNSNCEVFIDTNSVNVVTNGQMESKFTGSYIQFGRYQLRQTADGGLAFKLKE